MSRIQRRPQLHRFGNRDSLLELRLLELDADALLQRPAITRGIEREHRNAPAIRPPQSLHALHRRRLAGAVGSDQAEDLPLVHLERHVVDGKRPAVDLADAADLDDGMRGHFGMLAQ